MTDFPRKPLKQRAIGPSGRGLVTASIILSGVAVVSLVWWLFDDTRALWALGAGAVAAVAGALLGAWGRRALPGADEENGPW
jgi:hypothetical protein